MGRLLLVSWPMAETLAQTAACGDAREHSSRRRAQTGLLYGVGAYTIWGFIPLYFHAVSHVPSFVVLCHRIAWSALFMGVVVSVRGEWKSIWPVLRNGRNALLLATGAVLIALNWLIFIYSVASRQLLQASLGYFINPLLSIALGMFFLRERLRGWQWVAVSIAAVALANLALRGGSFPWIALSLAGSFGFYGLVRKTLDISSLHALTVESALLLPVACVALTVAPGRQVSAATLGVLSLSGVITAIPLLFFGAALRRLTLSTVGFLQYLGPTLQFLVAMFCFREPLDRAKLGSFILSWLAIGVYVADSLRSHISQALADEPE